VERDFSYDLLNDALAEIERCLPTVKELRELSLKNYYCLDCRYFNVFCFQARFRLKRKSFRCHHCHRYITVL
jgi:hypothetical protein